MVYLTELLVVTTDCFKIVRIRARNVPRKRLTTTRLSRLSLQQSDGVLSLLCWMRHERRPV